MQQLNDFLSNLIKGIKSDEEFSALSFVKGFSVCEYPDPFSDYMIAVSTLDSQLCTSFVNDSVMENVSGYMYDFSVKFRIFAPKNDGGDGLVAISNMLCESIKKHDTLSAIYDVKVSPIAFDESAMTVYRDVIANMSLCVYEEA